MKTVAVTGKNFGDEGKGLACHFLSRGAGRVLGVRHNGGSQSGHTVERKGPGGGRFVFHALSSGSFNGADTLWAQTFTPDLYKIGEEVQAFRAAAGFLPRIFAEEMTCVTVPDDVLINMNVWYDEAAMSVAGRQIMLADTYSEEVALEIVDAHPVNGDACARYLGMTADDTSLSYFGNGTVDGDGMLDGTYHLYYNTWPIVDVAVSDWDTATAKIGYLNGTAEITRSVMPTPEEVPEEMADILAFVSDYSINATFAGSPTVADCTLSVMNGQDQYATLKAHVDASARPELEAVPEGAEYIDATDEEAMNNFGANFDINALVQRVSDAGVPDEIIQLVLQNFLGAGASEEELAG